MKALLIFLFCICISSAEGASICDILTKARSGDPEGEYSEDVITTASVTTEIRTVINPDADAAGWNGLFPLAEIDKSDTPTPDADAFIGRCCLGVIFQPSQEKKTQYENWPELISAPKGIDGKTEWKDKVFLILRFNLKLKVMEVTNSKGVFYLTMSDKQLQSVTKYLESCMMIRRGFGK